MATNFAREPFNYILIFGLFPWMPAMSKQDEHLNLLTAFYLESSAISRLPEALRAWIGVAMIFAGVTFVLCVLISSGLILRLGWDALTGPTPAYQEAAKNFLFAFASGFGAPFLIWRAWTAHRQANAASEQVRVALENHVTGIFSKSVELMGFVRETAEPSPDRSPIARSAPNIEARLGGLYSLERLLLESEKDQRAILETICAYIRENSPLEIPRDETEAKAFSRGEMPPTPTHRADVQAAITIVGRRPKSVRTRTETQNWRIDIRNTNLVAYDFSNLNFNRADFDNSFLQASKLVGSSFEWCSFKNVFFKSADLTGTSFQHSIFDNCDMTNAKILNTNFREATLINVDLRRANVTSFDIRGANLDKAFHSMLDYMLNRVKQGSSIAAYDSQEFASISQLFKKAIVDQNTSVSETVREILILMNSKKISERTPDETQRNPETP